MFVGRQSEIARIENFVFKSKRQLLYIYGKRGVGKTTLINQFIQRHRELLDNKVLTIHGFISFGPNNEISLPKCELFVVDSFYQDIRWGEYSVGPIEMMLDNIVNYSPGKKIIVLSPEEPSFIEPNLTAKAEFLEIKPFSNQELDTLFRQALKNETNLNLNEFYKYFDNNPRSILTALSYYKHSSFDSGIDFLDFLNKPIKQNGLVDTYGNPLKSGTDETKMITQTIKVVNASLVERVNNNPSLIFEISPRNFEELVAELLEKEGFKVNLTKQTRDGGKDIFVAQKNNLGNFLYYVECKQYAPENPVGVNLVRELYGTISADRATAGLLVTSSYFTKDAISFTQNIQHQLSLKGYIDLKQWINDICFNKNGA